MNNSTAAEETFVLRATPSIKRYNIARFDVPEVPKFSRCAQPVMMYREPEKVLEDEEEKKEEEVGYNPALRKRRRRRRNTRTANWVIEDNESKNKFIGTFEGGQSSMYCLFVKNRHNDEFSVIPVEQWFRFKKPLSYRTLTLEEAEDLNNEKKRAVERWLMRHKLFADEKAESNDVIGGPRMRTGAVGGAKKKAGTGNDDDDVFEVKESKPRRAAPRPKAPEGDAMGEDGGDFDEKFDDDESEAEIENDEAKGVPSDSEEDELVEGEGTGKLTETGQAMKDLLKRAQSGEMDGNNENGEEVEEGSDDDYSAQDMEKVRRDLGGNIIRDRTPAAAAAPGEEVPGAPNAAEKPGEANGATAKPASATTEAANGKRKADDATGSEPASKSTKTSASSSSSSSTTRLTEAGVQQELLRYGGRMKTRDLLKKLKKLLVTDDDRALLKDILRTICEVEKDAIEGNIFVLKAQFR
ncbi:hypothetical protein ATCC90586_008339 [Pythium insidiosum]|nr:hypothetical protein ATCC90586_008339 [Pythium insidiosum]